MFITHGEEVGLQRQAMIYMKGGHELFPETSELKSFENNDDLGI